MEKLTGILSELGLSESEQTIYLSLIQGGRSTARMLSSRTSMTRPSVYDQLKLLRKRGLVVELDIDGKTYFSISNINQLDVLLSDKIDGLEVGREKLKETLPSLLSTLDLVQPKIRFFEGIDGVQQLMKDMLWHDKMEILVFWPYGSMLEVLGEDFLSWFNERREKRLISVRALWPIEEKGRKSHLFESDDENVSRRYLKNATVTEMGYVIYKNKVAFLSSSKEAFGFIVDSTEFATLQRMQYELLWSSASKK